MELIRRKKGSITDLPILIGGIFTVALVAILVTLLVNNINTQIQANDIIPTAGKTASTRMVDDVPNVMNGGIIFLFFGMCAVSLVLASLVPMHPIFLIFYFLEWVLLIWLGAGISNAYQAVIEMEILATEASQYQLTTYFFHYFPYALAIFGAILAIVMYKVKGGFWGSESSY